MSEGSGNFMETVSFRRFLSYIYAYEDDTKLRNVGFAKVEVRPPRVRFQITVNGILQKGGRPLELCLVDKNLQRIPVGQLMLQNGRGEYRGSSNLENLWDSGMAFSQVYGICLQGAGNRRHYYMTLWRETVRPVHTGRKHEEKRIVVMPANRENGGQKEEAEYIEKSGGAVVKAAAVENGPEEEEYTEEDGEMKAEEFKGEEVRIEEEVKAEEVKAEEVKAEEVEAEEVRIEEVREEAVKTKEAKTEEARTEIKEGEIKAEIGAGEFQQESDHEFQEEFESASELISQQSVTQQQENGTGSHSSVSVMNRRQSWGRKNADKSMELWKRFCTRYPHVDIRPLCFDGSASEDGFGKIGKVCEVLRIRPNDIGRLPRNNWILAHNSFLQNAYNHYHQLILFRVENQEIDSRPGNRWFIGLPGEHSEQETLVAEVFGFKKYLSCKNGGFWYTEIMLG